MPTASKGWLSWFQKEICFHVNSWENDPTSHLVKSFLMFLWPQLLVCLSLFFRERFRVWLLSYSQVATAACPLVLSQIRISKPAPPLSPNMLTSSHTKKTKNKMAMARIPHLKLQNSNAETKGWCHSGSIHSMDTICSRSHCQWVHLAATRSHYQQWLMLGVDLFIRPLLFSET